MKTFTIKTDARTQFVDITARVRECVDALGVSDGAINVYVPHTTAGVTINEGYDPDVMRDMTTVLDNLVPWSNGYRHAEGNTAAHVKAAMMGTSQHILVKDRQLCLGRWQAIFFCEFDGPRTREVWVG